MIDRALCALAVALAVATGLLTNPSVASAHHPTITAEVVCEPSPASCRSTSRRLLGKVGARDPTYYSTRARSADRHPLRRRHGDVRRIRRAELLVFRVAADSGRQGRRRCRRGECARSWHREKRGHHPTTWVDADYLDLAGGDEELAGGDVQPAGAIRLRVGDVRVTRGLTIHCDFLLSNNLEVNWGGDKFHMTEHLTTVECSDDPLIIQAPPPAPLDTLVGIGTGHTTASTATPSSSRWWTTGSRA